jgi:divalent metal cation (Fe/Co/Zn/Cd) transporter
MMNKNVYTKVIYLAWFTILYNIVEGLVSIYFGFNDETLALFGFGIDSFIEVVSGTGILVMAFRIGKNSSTEKTRFEKTALKITGWSFYILAIGLVITSVVNIIYGHKPETTFWGIIVSTISIIVMYVLYKSKTSYGKKIGSEPVIADGRCTLVCIYMSIVLLGSSLIYEMTGLGWIDTLGALGLAWFSFSEGREALEKAKGSECSCCNDSEC